MLWPECLHMNGVDASTEIRALSTVFPLAYSPLQDLWKDYSCGECFL